jgi:hypothetical protein
MVASIPIRYSIDQVEKKEKEKLVKIPPEIAAPFGFCVAVYTFDITYK